MKQHIAFFDFDGTITYADTLLAFIAYCHGRRAAVWGWLRLVPVLVKYRLGFVSNQQAKERVLAHFFGGMAQQVFQQHCNGFSREVLPRLVRPLALQEIRRLQLAGYQLVVVSASPENWLKPWCQQHGIDLIASQLELVQGRLTGKLAGANCHGTEKVRRIRLAYPLEAYTDVAAYGDTPGDKPMLALAAIQHYKPFRQTGVQAWRRL